jgi:ribosomal protein L37AE/L43A
MPREEFPATVKRDLATRAAHFCSNPRCLRLTSGPQVTGSRGTGTGHAAHIRAAAIGGPRYDPGQTPDQRRSIENGIWLCRECGDMVDKDTEGFAPETLHSWRINHEAMIAEIRQKGWSKTIELLRSGPAQPALARRIISIFEDRRVFWASFDVEFPDRVRVSLDNLRHELTKLRSDCMPGSPIENVIVALAKTIRSFFDMVEEFNLSTLRCDGNDPEWLAFETALRTLRKSIGFQIAALADSYSMPLQGEFAGSAPRA